MTTEEKLTSFYMNCLTTATEDAQKLVDEHRAALEKIYQDYVKQRSLQSASELTVREEEIRRDNNKALSDAQLTVRRRLSSRTQELKDELFRDVEKKLLDFKKTPDYTDYVCRKIDIALGLAGNDRQDLEVYMDASDAGLFGEITSRCGVEILEARAQMLGGVRIVVQSRELLVNYAFRDLLNEEKDAFTFQGGPTQHE